jgi:VWFA-related protein
LKLPTAFSGTSRIRVALLLCLATAASGQENKPAPILPNSSPLTFELPDGIASDQAPDPAQGLISFDVSVTDKAGKPVSGLSEKGFALLDNDRQQKIVSFQAFDGAMAQAANSLEIVLVLDELNLGSDSENGETKLSNVHREIENFLRANGGVLEKPTIIYRITRDGLFATPHASMDGNELAQEIEQPALQRQIWSPSAIPRDINTIVKFVGLSPAPRIEAVWRDITQSLVALGSIAIEERRRPGRKLMFWLGNGWQITEKPMATGFSDFSIELLTRLREARINLWSASKLDDASGNEGLITEVNQEIVEEPKTDSTDLRYLSLPVIATRSGGGMLKTGDNLAARIGERVREESSYYFLTFDPPRTDVVDQYHHLKLDIDKPGLQAHVFEDYYDQPVFYDQAPAAQSITMSQLQTLIASAKHISDAKLARQFDNMRLTERLSSAKLAVMEKSVYGKQARQALEVLADRSAFYDPPDEEIAAAPPPEMSAQQQMISRAISYIDSTIPHLPDLLATRTSVQYYEHPAGDGSTAAAPSGLVAALNYANLGATASANASTSEDQTWKTAPADQSLYAGETTIASIRFRKGQELVKEESVKKTPGMQGGQHLKTVGAFGPILGTIMVALTSAHGELNWSRWEQGDNGRLAIFRYHVSQETPFFTTGFCCLPIDNESIPFIKSVPFHGEIAVDPSTGAIMRLTVQANLAWRLPLERSDVMVEYHPVPGGSMTFICPSRSVSIARQRGTITIHEWGEAFKVYAPFETLLNEMRFEKYHIFGSTSRILPGFVDVPKMSKSGR